MDFVKEIGPFKIIYHEKNTSFILNDDDYRREVFAERKDEGFRGCGYDWGSLASVFLEEKMPELESQIKLDSEADMFCVYSKDRQSLEKFAVAFHAMCSDQEQMRDLFSRAELD